MPAFRRRDKPATCRNKANGGMPAIATPPECYPAPGSPAYGGRSMGGKNMRTSIITTLALGTALVVAGAANAQQRHPGGIAQAGPPPAPAPAPEYGMPITTEQAKIAAAAAVAEAMRNGWKM